MIKGIDDTFQPCNVNVIRVSDMTRAKETASIISHYLPSSVQRVDPDPLLNEGM
jgi:broad specificity phosphatase PhoE